MSVSLGKKYVCFKCKTKFYDLGKPDPMCPKCGADQRDDPKPDPSEVYNTRPKRSSASFAAEPVRAKKPIGEDEEEEEFDEDFIDDADSSLEDEDDDYDFEEEAEEPDDDDDY